MTESTAHAPRRATLAFIFVTVALDMLALGVIIPVLPKLVVGFSGGDTVHAAKIYGLFGTVWALMQFVASPVLGALSDRFGRRPVILLSNLGLGLDYILMALAPSLSWLFVGRSISGITSASVPTAGAYIADVLPPEKRAAGFGLLGAAFGLGFVLGPALGGILGSVDARLPFWVAGGLSLVNAMYGVFVLPESLPPERRAAFAWRRANPLGALRLLRSQRGLLGLAGVNLLSYTAHEVLPSTFVLYASYRYAWNERTVGLLLATVGVSSVIVQAAVVRPTVRRFGERRVLLGALAFGALGFAMYGVAALPVMIWIGVPVNALWGLASPASQGLMTRRVEDSQQGQLQGANSSLRGIAGLVGPSLFTLTFAHFIDPHSQVHLPGAAFLVACTLLLLAVALAWHTTRSIPIHDASTGAATHGTTPT